MSSADPNTQISGSVMLPVVDSLIYSNIEHVLQNHDIAEIYPDEWYSQQKWASVLETISENNGGMFDLIALGRKIIQLSPKTPHVTLSQVLYGLDAAMQQSHRNGPYGDIRVEEQHGQRIDIIVDTPYPPDLWYGILYELAQQYAPEDGDIQVTYEDFKTSRTSTKACRIIIQW